MITTLTFEKLMFSVRVFFISAPNLTKDLNKKITDIQYNCLNLLSRIQFENGNSIFNVYDTNGTKLCATHIIDNISTMIKY